VNSGSEAPKDLYTQGVRIMFTRSKHIAPRAIALLAAILSTAALGIALPMSDQTSTVFDPIGDLWFRNAPAFQDIVRVQVTKTEGGDLHLLMEMAGNLPTAPPLPPPGVREIWWSGARLRPDRISCATPTPDGVRAEFCLRSLGWHRVRRNLDRQEASPDWRRCDHYFHPIQHRRRDR
jgi:hypothetical protein